MLKFLRMLPVPLLTIALVALLAERSGGQNPPDPIQQAKARAAIMAKGLRVLREDIDIDLPDARGANLGEIVDRAVFQVRQLQRGIRAGMTPAQLHAIVVELDKTLDQLLASATRLGADAYYVRKSAATINAHNEALARTLAPPTIPPRVFILTEQIAKNLDALRDDISIDLPDARGKTLGDLADQSLVQVRHIHRGARTGAPPEHLREHATELNRDLQRLTTSAASLGADGYYLHRSAAQIQAQGAALLNTLGSR